VYAVLTDVEFAPGRHDAATEMLHKDLIPGVKQAPGFVRGTWFGDDSTGHGVVTFESEEHARQALQALDAIEMEGVRVTSSAVYQVDGEA
jgi:hypothetical protein